MPQPSLGGFGNVNYRAPMPIGGGQAAQNPVGGILQMLMRMQAGGGQPAPETPPGYDAHMAELLGLKKRPPVMPQQQAQAMPLESWIGAR